MSYKFNVDCCLSFLTFWTRSCSNGSMLQLLENMIMPQNLPAWCCNFKQGCMFSSEFQPSLILTFVCPFYHATFTLWQHFILWHYLDAKRRDSFVTRFDIIFYTSDAFCLHFSMSKKHYLKTHTGWTFQRFLSLKCLEVLRGFLKVIY